MKSPFKFLDPYEADDYQSFFGRDAETKELFSLVTKNRLTFVYGPSGTGKTSLVQCGLANRFGGTDWLPIPIRRGEDINASIRHEIGKALGENAAFTGDITEGIGALFNRYLRPVYLIFDQFEELFILGKNDPEEKERQPFYDTIAAILDAELPCRLLFILREDYFAHLNQFEKNVPELYHRKLRVEPMSRENLLAVVTGSCKVHDIAFGNERRDPDLILDNILAGKAGTHMPYVQVYLHMLYQEAVLSGSGSGSSSSSSSFNRRRNESGGSDSAGRRKSSEDGDIVFDEAVIKGVGEITDALERFLKEQEETILKNLKAKKLAPPDDVVRRVLDPFVSEEGTKVPVTYQVGHDDVKVLQGKAARRLSGLTPALVSACLDELEESRILRRSETDYELAHDTLAAIVAGQRSAALQQERDAYNSIEAGYREHVQALEKGEDAFFDRKRLNRLDLFLDKIELPPEWIAFIDASRAEADRLEKAEIERTERELRLAQEKLATEQKARERQRRSNQIVRIAAAVAIGLAIFALTQWREAKIQTENALIATKTAQRSDSLAQIDKDSAILSRDNARLATLAAQRSDSVSKREKARADQALLDAKGNAKIAVSTLLTVADKAVKQLNYGEASEAVNAAVRLEENKPEVANALLEMAFFHNHTRDWQAAAKETATAARWLGKGEIAAQAERVSAANALRELRRLQKTLAPVRFAELDIRYFPEMVPVKGGTFIPGCVKPGDDLCRRYNKDSLYRATLSDYQLARTETTVWQYNLYALATELNINQRLGPDSTKAEEDYAPSWGWVGDHPVVYVNWYDAVLYANWASVQQGFTPVYTVLKTVRDTNKLSDYDDFKWTVAINEGTNGYRLPTEAEWEFAARGGMQQDTFKYAGSDNLDEVAWWSSNSGSHTHAVRGKQPNDLQLYDLTGNVWEWCWDWYRDYPEKPEMDYRGFPSGSGRVLRGGSWILNSGGNYRVAIRYGNDPNIRFNDYGFRVARH